MLSFLLLKSATDCEGSASKANLPCFTDKETDGT